MHLQRLILKQKLIATGFIDTVTPKEMTITDIKETISDFKIVLKNAVAAGFDGVELHAANGYLFHQFYIF
jgi:N-ethylmaleimide reductase